MSRRAWSLVPLSVHAGEVGIRIRRDVPSGADGAAPIWPVTYEDELSFFVSAAEITLDVTHPGTPPSAAIESRLLRLLYRRATSRSALALLPAAEGTPS